MSVRVDFNAPRGKIKPLHGVGNGPFTLNFTENHIADFVRAGIPYCRLHDTEYPKGSGKFVDIHCIFPDFEKDPEDPASYHFTETDRYLEAIEASGARPIYRLGESIDHNPVKEFVFPPKSAEKWANVCEHIIAHYTEGWANGYHMDIPFWEIWNEPDNEPEIAKNPMWQGTEQQYFELYVVTANRLKKRFPHLFIGGFGSCGFYAITGTDVSAAAKSTPRFEYFIEFAHRFFRYITDPAHPAPLDFFSWHSYAGKLEDNIKFARYARNLLNHYGFENCISMLNEWNPRPARVRNVPEEAAAVAAHVCVLQQESVDIATYYDGRPGSGYCALFDVNGKVLHGFDAFLAFGEMYRTEEAVEVSFDAPVCAAAARRGEEGLLLLVNYSDAPCEVSLEVAGGENPCDYSFAERRRGAPLPEGPVALEPWQIRMISYQKKG